MDTIPSEVRYDEVVVSILPAYPDGDQPEISRSRDPGSPRSYDALIYGAIDGPWRSSERVAPPLGQPAEIKSLPLAGHERLDIGWDRYHEYRRVFADRQPLATVLREHLIDGISPGLKALLAGEIESERPVRVWWFTRAPELGELPWEVIAGGSRAGRFSFVRGRPRSLVPIVPLRDRLRLAFIRNPETTPVALSDVLSSLPPTVEVVTMSEPPRAALARAVHERFELVHLVASGTVSLAFDGILQPYGDQSESISHGELSRMLSGSRVSILGLTPPTSRLGADQDDDEVPHSVMYRAFSYVGMSREPLPTVVAPLAPLTREALGQFWRSFYEQLAETLSVEEAFSRMPDGAEPLPMALFLRHRLARQFARQDHAAADDAPDPTQINTELQVSRELVEQVRGINAAFTELDDDATYASLIDDELARQERLQDTLSSWNERSEVKA